jgi:UDP-N-acetyl-2-amino-2-deoxyglucuronate dehydrogenase
MQAIAETGNKLIAAVDPHDSVGVLDRYFPEAAFFTEVERFDRFLEKKRRLGDAERVHYISICSPNYLHDAHVRLALRVGAHAICEKPLVISPWNLDQLAALESEYDRRVYTVRQLRLLPQLRELAAKVHASRLPTSARARPSASPPSTHVDVELTYITARGPWYHQSWKGVPEKSGGLALNIGIHFFDLLIWLYGKPGRSQVTLSRADKMSGVFELEHARVRWFLSIDPTDLPSAVRAAGRTAYRSLIAGGRELEVSDGHHNRFTEVYRDVLAGGGSSIEDVRPSVELAHAIRTAPVTASPDAHPLAR